MPTTFTALLVLFVAILPGALYTWAFEREVGRWGIGLSDRLLRFVGVSALFLTLLTYPAHYLWRNYLHVPGDADRFTNLVLDGATVPPWLYVVPVGYVAVPLALGSLAAVAVRRKWRMARLLAGADPAPRAWDFLFAARPHGVVRIRLQDGAGWVGGLFRETSYAAGYPDEPQDLYLQETYQLLSSGEFAADASGELVSLGSSLLVKWEDILHLEFFADPDESKEGR